MKIRFVTHNEIEQIKAVIDSRSKMMLSNQNVHPNFFAHHFENETNFKRNLCFGLFEDDLLDSFIHVELWPELPVYSQNIYTKAKPNRIKTEDGFDQNMSTLLDHQLKYMENVGMYTLYNVTNASQKWKPFHTSLNNRFSKYEVEIVEYIPIGDLSKFILFRNHLVSRPFDVPLNIKKHVLPLNLRG